MLKFVFFNIEALYKTLYKDLYKVLYKFIYKALHEALYKALYKTLYKVLYKALYKALHKALYWVPAIFLIAFIYTSAKYTPYIHLGSHLIFYPFLYPPYLGRH